MLTDQLRINRTSTAMVELINLFNKHSNKIEISLWILVIVSILLFETNALSSVFIIGSPFALLFGFYFLSAFITSSPYSNTVLSLAAYLILNIGYSSTVLGMMYHVLNIDRDLHLLLGEMLTILVCALVVIMSNRSTKLNGSKRIIIRSFFIITMAVLTILFE